MKKTKTIMSSKIIVDDIICNRCGNSCKVHSEFLEHVSVDVTWGYWSKKDMERHQWDLCEQCHDEITATFKVPPTITEVDFG